MDALDELLSEILWKNLIIIGDFNSDMFKEEHYGERLNYVMERRGIHQLVEKLKFSTHVCVNQVHHCQVITS